MDPETQNEIPSFADLADLKPAKLQQLETTVAFILALPLAQSIYAQLIDGRRTWQSYVDPSTRGFRKEVLIVSDHPSPSSEAMQLYEEFRRVFRLQILKIDVKLAQQYQNAPIDSRDHELRLLEMTAASLNALAGTIYLACHPELELNPPSQSPEDHDFSFKQTQSHTDFYHTDYQEYWRYPFGLLNVIGYWAETQLFAGVLLFDHGESGSEIKDTYIHPQEVFQAYRISSQQLAGFSKLRRLEATGQPENPLPFIQEQNAHIKETWVRAGDAPLRIYKNEYDKPPPSWVPARPSCTESHDEGLLVSIEEAMRIVKENGWEESMLILRILLWRFKLPFQRRA